MSSKRPILRGAVLAVVGLLLTVGLAVHLSREPGVWYAESHVLFLAPNSTANPDNLVTPSDGVTALAGVVARLIEPNPPDGQVASPTVTLVDEGIRNGSSVTLPNDGGQYTNNFDQQLLQVQAVASNPAVVRARVQALVAEINADLKRLQNDGHVPTVDRITTRENPATLQVKYLSGSKKQALGAVLVLGVALTLSAEMLAYRWWGRSRRFAAGITTE